MACIKKINALDRLILGARTQEVAERRAHEPACRLLVERLKWATLFTIVIAIFGVGLMWSVQAKAAEDARQQLAEIVATDCIDRAGDRAFRNLLADLVKLNEEAQRKPPLLSVTQARQRTIAALREAAKEAGPAPQCILNHVP